MKKYLVLLLFIGCASSSQILKDSKSQDVKTDEQQTILEKERTKDLKEFIENLNIDDFDKKFIIKQISYKDEQLELKDRRIKSLSDEIEAYRIAAEKTDSKADIITSQATEKIEECARDAGKGDVLTGLFYIAIGAGVIFVLWLLLTKLNVKNFIFGKKE